MTIPVSTVPAIKAYLVGIFTARSELADPIQVCYNAPATYAGDDLIIVGGSQGAFTPYRMVGSGGAGWLSEQYQIDVTVYAFCGDDDPQYIEERAFALGAACIDAVRLDPSLGGLCINAYPIQYELDPEWDDKHLGRHVAYSIRFFVDASI